MQRWLFFIFCVSIGIIQAQSIDILSVELSFYRHGRFASADKNVLNSKAKYTLEIPSGTDEVAMQAQALKVHSVKLREGRLKDDFDFRQEGNTVSIVIPPACRGKKIELELEYSIQLTDPSIKLFVQRTDDVLAFNPMNANTETPMGQAGMFFPSISGDALHIGLNISTSNEENIGFPGSEEYRVNFENGVAHFWQTRASIMPEAFYLVIGTFREFDAEEMEEEFMLGEVVLKQMKFEKSKRAVAPYMELYGLSQEAVSDSEYAIIDSLSNQDFSAYFISKEDFGDISSQQYQAEAAIAYYLEGQKMTHASNKFERAYRKNKGDDWYSSVMAEKWLNREQLSEAHYEKVLAFRLAKYQMENPDLIKVMKPEELDTALIKPLMQNKKLVSLNVEYRYVAGDTALYINYQQDTINGQLYHFPIRITAVKGEQMDTAWQIIREAEGVLKLTLEGSPNMASVYLGEYFPGKVEDRKPDTYNLYQLSNASGPQERKQALEGLFKTKNVNLFSTALGIAMDDPEASIRNLALDNATDLTVPAQRKLKDTLINLSKMDDNAEVREKAKILVTKYYETK